MWVTGERLSFFTMVAWFPKWAAGLLPGSASAGMLTGTVGEVVRQPVSALHIAVSPPVESCSGSLCSSSEEFAFGLVFYAQHQEIWRTGSRRRQDET